MNRPDVEQAILEVGRDGWGGERRTGVEAAGLLGAARRAAAFISLLPDSVPSPAVTQGEDGGLALEWRSGDGGVLVIEFREDGRAVYQVRSGGVECRGETDVVEDLARLIAEAMSP